MRAGSVLSSLVMLSLVCACGSGCGSTQQRDATEQLMTSDAVDRSVAQMDFRALAGQKVFFDTAYLKNIKGVGFVNAEYITSSLRQQMIAARCLLQDKLEEADYIVEARIGTLGMDRHEVTYGIPANNLLSAASTYVPGAPPVPTLPELALAKRNEQLAAAKIGAFAYHRETREPVWQSGVATIRSSAKDTWIMGAGPIQRGDIYGGTQFAGTKVGFSLFASEEDSPLPIVDYNKPAYFSPSLCENEQEPKEGEAEASSSSQEAVKSPSPAPPTAEKKPAEQKPAVPQVKPKVAPPAPNPLPKEVQEEGGLRLRLRFDQTHEAQGDEKPGTLFRLSTEK